MRTCTVCETQYGDDVLVCPEDGAKTRGGTPPPRLTTEQVDPLMGRMVGSYRITKLLGRGGMGTVYAAEHPAIGSRVAIKFLKEQYAGDKAIVSRFFNEARAVNVINHDNIVRVVDYAFLDDQMPYFVMEMLDQGYELGKLTKGAGPVGLEVAGPIVLQVCDALQAAHSHNIVHRDLKPDNIFLAERSGRKHFVKLMDFGIAKLAGAAEQGQTQTGMVMGTPHYMSPEQASGMSSRIDGRSDLYSLGVIMYQMAAGLLPFKGESFAETLVAHITQPPRPPRELNPNVPPRYEQIILKTIAKRPEERYQTARELAMDVAELMRTLGLSTELPYVGTESAPGASVGSAHTVVRTPPQTPVVPGGRHQATDGATIALSAEDLIEGEETRLPGPRPEPVETAASSATPSAAKPAAPTPATMKPAAAARKGSAAAVVLVWALGIVLGAGTVVGLRKGGVIQTRGDELAAEVKSLEANLQALPPLPPLPPETTPAAEKTPEPAPAAPAAAPPPPADAAAAKPTQP